MTILNDIEAGPRAEVHDLTRARLTTKSPVLEEAWRYWSSLRPDGGVPARSDLDPRAMSLILGHAMILDRVRPGTVRVRVGGRVPNALMGMETRGLPVRAFFDLLQRGRAVALAERVFTEVATLELDLMSDGPGTPLAARMIVLPLRDRAGAVTKALAVLVPERVEDEGPRRFAILREHLGAIRLADRRRAHAPGPAAPAFEAAEAQAPFEAEAPLSAAPWLRVVK